MSRLGVWQNSRFLRLGLGLILGLTLFVGLLLVMDLTYSPGVALAEGSTIRYVAPAPTGNDSGNDCTSGRTPCATLQHAVDVADSSDEIRAASGTYTSTGENVVLITETLTLIGGYEPPDWSIPVSYTTTRIDGERARRGIEVQGMISVTLSNLMVTRGRASYSGGLWQRTGMSRLEIRNSRFEDNVVPWTYAHDGGGALQSLGTVTLYNTEIISNHARKMGGGLYFRGPAATLIKTRVLSNSTHNIGGGLLSIRTLTVIDSVFKHNATLTPVRQPYYGGGAIWADGAAVTISGTQIADNTATRRGGGLYLQGSVLTLTNSIVADNRAASLGGGLYITDASATLVHTTLARNRGSDGSGVHVGGAGSTAALTNTILVSHTLGLTVTAGSTATLEATLWGTDTWANHTDWGGAGDIRSSSNLWGDPAFVDPDAGDYHIGFDSAAIDAGVDTGVRQDIDGDPRPALSGYDLGADEFWPRIYLPLVTKSGRLTTTIHGVYTLVGNPCTTDPCLPGLVYSVVESGIPYHLTVEGHWIWSNGKPDWNGYVPELNDLVIVTGNVTTETDISDRPYYNMEVMSLVPAQE